MRTIRRFFRRLRRAKTDAQYALLFHKVSRRLGYARAQNRQLRNENEFLRDFYQRNRRDTLRVVDSGTNKSDTKTA